MCNALVHIEKLLDAGKKQCVAMLALALVSFIF